MTANFNANAGRPRYASLRIATLAVVVAFSFALCRAQTPPKSMEQLWQEAAQAQQAQQYLHAASLYKKILALRPDLTEAEVNLGLMFQLAG